MSSLSEIRAKAQQENQFIAIPIELTNIIAKEIKAGINIVDEPTQVYAKTAHGEGSIQFKNGHQYVGQLHNGILHGQGQFSWNNGTVYKGDFLYNKITGVGQYTWPDGSKYYGEVINGLRHGKGKFHAAQDEHVYDGQWQNGLRHGLGKFTFKSSSEYDGEFYEGLKQGKGKMTYASGNYYQGEWHQDKKSGNGIMEWLNSNEKYVGEWQNNLQHGNGEHTWMEVSTEGKFLRNRYLGNWQDGKRHGYGVFYYANGSKYEGEWKDNMKHGFAIFTQESGQIQVQNFKNDKPVQTIKAKIETTEESNPYYLMTNFTDLFSYENETQKAYILKELHNMLLRHNTTLKSIYRFFSNQDDEYHNSNSYSMNLNQFWKLLKQARIQTPQVGIPAINRLFLQGCQNHFELSTTPKQLKQRVEALKAHYDQLRNDDEIMLITYNQIQQIVNQKQKMKYDESDIDSKLIVEFNTCKVHDPERLVLFRHFIELLVRSAYLQNDYKMDEIHRVVEKLIENKLKPFVQNTKNSQIIDQNDVSLSSGVVDKKIDDNQLLQKYLNQFKQHENLLWQIFQNNSTKQNYSAFGLEDTSIQLCVLIQLLENAGLIQSENQILKIALIAERFYDKDSQIISLEDLKLQKGDKKNSKKDQKIDEFIAVQKEIRLHQTFESEIIFSEFLQIISLFFTKDMNMKSSELTRYLDESVHKFIEINLINQQIYEERKIKPSDKDEQVVLLQQKRKRERDEAELKKQLAEQESRRQYELEQMRKEDINVIDSDIENKSEDMSDFEV